MRVAVVEGQNHVRSALCFFIESQPGMQLAGAFGSQPDLVVRLLALQPDVVLLDWELPDLQAEQVLFAVRGASPPTRVLALSTRSGDEARACAAGVDAFICKSQPPRLLIPSLYSGWQERKDSR
jgi:DNA-binding NarL/FixJ family response regulator